MNRVCEFSPCRRYRYTLWRDFPDMFNPEKTDLYLMVIGLNPSTADETNDDPTIRRCIAFAKRWGYQTLCMTNLFAWRDTDPKMMMKAPDPVGPDNDKWLQECAAGAGMVLAAWGRHGWHLGRAQAVAKLITNLHCLRLNTSDSSPQHPLYVPGNTEPKPYRLP